MKLLKRKKLAILLLILMIFIVRYIINVNTVYHKPDYEYKSVKKEISKTSMQEIDFNYISKYTGLSPYSARQMIENGEEEKLLEINSKYFETPVYKKDYIAFPVTAQERCEKEVVSLAEIEDGDILITYNTHTLCWRHGHAAIVVDADSGIILEHMAIGQTSVLSSASKWSAYPGFILLRHPDSEVAKAAADYASKHLRNVKYSITAGLIKKDKSQMERVDASHCSHIVWQAYKAVGVDIDSNKGAVVTPEDIAMSSELKVVQIYGIDPKDYSDRFLC